MSLPICGRLVACDALLGAPRVPLFGYIPDATDLEAEMARLHIDASIVRHRACLEAAPYVGNDILMSDIAERPHLIPAWFVTPDGREPDFDPEGMIEHMVSAGVRLAWLDPDAEMMSMLPWCAGELYAALQERRIPLMISYPKVKADDLHVVLQEYPELPVILINVLRLGRNRVLEPLLALHPTLNLCFGPSFSVHNYYQNLVRRFGPYRWVWGANYPEYEGGAGVAGLTYSGLSAEDMAQVAHGNIERLLAEVQV